MGNFTFEEMNLMCIYNTGSRTGLIKSVVDQLKNQPKAEHKKTAPKKSAEREI